MIVWKKRIGWAVILALVLLGTIWLAAPRPVLVDIAAVVSGPMEVTVDDEAKTRVRDVYTVSAPLMGRVLRNPRRVGDAVIVDETVVAVMQPITPSLLDVRSREELGAAVSATEAAVKLAEAEVRRIEAALEYARTELNRVEALLRTNTASLKAADKAKFDVDTNAAALASAKAQLDVRRHELHNAKARLIDPNNSSPQGSSCCVQVRAPVTGRVLKIILESESVVQAGTPLIEIGDPANLEVVADFLSTDAVQIRIGAPVRIDGWGGPSLRGRVTRIDPAGFLKVSALGIEEQRVRTVIELNDPREIWAQLGHDYRVIAHVTIWMSDNALTVPVGALFRNGDNWAVFAMKDGRARMTVVRIGRRNNRVAEVLSGLVAGNKVVLHPSDRIADGASISARSTR